MDIDDRYQQYLTAGLKLDLTRGKPCPEQLTLSEGLDATIAGDYVPGAAQAAPAEDSQVEGAPGEGSSDAADKGQTAEAEGT